MSFFRTVSVALTIAAASFGTGAHDQDLDLALIVEIADEARSEPVSITPEVIIDDAPASQRSEVARAVARFTDAGLALPDLHVSFHDSEEPCDGHHGLFNAPGRVRICSDLPFVLTHEIAHAWERANVDNAIRAEFLAFTGLPSWRNVDTPWNDRGAEQAAITIQKVLMTDWAELDLDFWAEHAERYEILTGTAPAWA